ncbi:MAG: T9SS type A sorting domain-containing protein [Bacteroidales bacterium]|nr:T9SS type A sorting domain-containing protein [Bacteroidales bacterium]
MKNFLLITGIIVVGLASLQSTSDILYSTQPPVEKTGAPNEGLCSDCHINSGGGNGSVSIDFNDGNNLFKYGETYPITVNVEDSEQSRFGFELTEIDQTGITIGEFTLLNQDNTALQSANNRDYVSHFEADDNNSWEFEWTAPPESSGITEVTFYAAGNATNNNGSTSGDHVYSTSLTVELDTQGLDDEENPISKVYQSNSDLNLAYFSGQQTELKIRLFDISGRVVSSFVKQANAGNNLFSLPIEKADQGVHIISVTDNGKTHTGKVVLR